MLPDISSVATVPPNTYIGSAYRHMAAEWDDPLTGEGARIRGGRFNPPDSFPVLYLCTTRQCAVAELRRLGERQVIGTAGLLPRVLYRYEVSLERVLDLTTTTSLDHLGVTRTQIIGHELDVPRQIGEAAHTSEFQATLAPSATGVDAVLAVFPESIGGGRLVPELIERWASVGDI